MCICTQRAAHINNVCILYAHDVTLISCSKEVVFLTSYGEISCLQRGNGNCWGSIHILYQQGDPQSMVAYSRHLTHIVVLLSCLSHTLCNWGWLKLISTMTILNHMTLTLCQKRILNQYNHDWGWFKMISTIIILNHMHFTPCQNRIFNWCDCNRGWSRLISNMIIFNHVHLTLCWNRILNWCNHNWGWSRLISSLKILNHDYIDWGSYFKDEWGVKQLRMVKVDNNQENPQSWLH